MRTRKVRVLTSSVLNQPTPRPARSKVSKPLSCQSFAFWKLFATLLVVTLLLVGVMERWTKWSLFRLGGREREELGETAMVLVAVHLGVFSGIFSVIK